jgi:hypothetical protein
MKFRKDLMLQMEWEPVANINTIQLSTGTRLSSSEYQQPHRTVQMPSTTRSVATEVTKMRQFTAAAIRTFLTPTSVRGTSKQKRIRTNCWIISMHVRQHVTSTGSTLLAECESNSVTGSSNGVNTLRVSVVITMLCLTASNWPVPQNIWRYRRDVARTVIVKAGFDCISTPRPVHQLAYPEDWRLCNHADSPVYKNLSSRFRRRSCVYRHHGDVRSESTRSFCHSLHSSGKVTRGQWCRSTFCDSFPGLELDTNTSHDLNHAVTDADSSPP